MHALGVDKAMHVCELNALINIHCCIINDYAHAQCELNALINIHCCIINDYAHAQ